MNNFEEDDSLVAMRVSVFTMIGNFLLAFLKGFAGIISNSGSMISDAIHSCSDSFSTLIVIIGIKISKKKSDSTHQYGHERFEMIASILLSFLLFITSFGIVVDGVNNLFVGSYDNIPGIFALIVAMVSIFVKEFMYLCTKRVALRANSSSMLADAWHHRSDALSSVGALIGIIGARLGYPVFELLACIIISIFICKTGIEIFIDSVNKLVDKSCNEEFISDIKKVIISYDEIIKIDDIKTRIFGNRIYIDMEISLDGNLTLISAHEIAHKVHDLIEDKFPKVKHCMIHVNPLSN